MNFELIISLITRENRDALATSSTHNRNSAWHRWRENTPFVTQQTDMDMPFEILHDAGIERVEPFLQACAHSHQYLPLLILGKRIHALLPSRDIIGRFYFYSSAASAEVDIKEYPLHYFLFLYLGKHQH